MLLPTTCGACGGPGGSPCPACRALLRRPSPTLTPPPGIEVLWALLAYEGAGRELVARLKYRNARAALPWIADALASQVVERPDLVTWVPTSRARRRARGFDQAALLARAVASRLGVPCAALLERGDGPPQTGRSARERRSPPPVALRSRGRRLVPGRRVLVVDDVCTTGASLTAAAVALRSAGAERVDAAVAARTASRPGPAAPTGPTLTHGPGSGGRRPVGDDG